MDYIIKTFVPDIFSLSFIISIIPDFILHGIVLTGLVGFIITSIPLLPLPMKTFYRILFLLILLIGVFLEGVNYDTMKSKTELKASKEKIKVLEKQLKDLSEATDKNFEKIVKKLQERGENIHEKVSKIVPKSADKQCVIPDDVRVLHNEAAGYWEIPNATRSTDGKSKETKTDKLELSELLETTFDNYNDCLVTREKLIALQNWVREAEKLKKNVR